MALNAIRSFRDLEVWHSAMLVARVAHTIALKFPAVQTFALGAQVRRSATSIPSNVAEGHAHRGVRTYLRHIRIALGSLAELDTQLELALDLKLIERRMSTASRPSWSGAATCFMAWSERSPVECSARVPLS